MYGLRRKTRPGSPGATGSPSAHSTFTSVVGIGRPPVAGRSSASSAVAAQIAAPDSVSEYRLRQVQPGTARRIPPITASETGEPACQAACRRTPSTGSAQASPTRTIIDGTQNQNLV